MLKLAFKGLLARKLRTALTGFAVVLGVAFVAGTFIFTDTIDASFKNLFERTQKGVDVSVQARLAVEEEFAAPPTMPADTLERVQSVDGVEEAAGSVSSDGTLLDRKGEPILSQGPPTIVTSAGPERFDPLTYVEGGRPETADEVVIDKGTADEYEFAVGDRVTVSGRAPAEQYTVSGISTLGDTENLAGSRLVLMTLPEAQRVTGHDGYDEISVAAEGGTTPEQLKAAIAAELGGRDFAVRTGKEQAEKQAQDLSDALGFIRTALLVFAGVALLVGSFLIFNTFSVTVAQRAKEFALLRTLGASRGQIMRSVLAETVVIGLLASLVGIGAGMLLAPGLAAMMASFGIDLGTTGTQLEPRTIVAGLVVGMLATVVSGFVPARRATRVEPVEAMRESVTPGPGRPTRRRVAVAAIVEASGVAALFYGLFGDPGTANATALVLGLGSLLMVFGFALIAPVLVRPLSSVIGRPLERFQGLTGRLARENTTRQPQRTAVTASALMIGVALVVLVATFAAGLRATIDQGIDKQVKSAGIVTHEDNFSPLPGGVTERLARVDGVTAISAVRFETGNLAGTKGTQTLTGIDPKSVRDVLTLEWKQGSDATLAALGEREVVVTSDFATQHDLAAGDTVGFGTPRGRDVTYRVKGIYDPAAGVIGGLLVSNASLERDWEAKDIAFALVAGAPGADPGTIKRGEEAALAEFPTAKPQTIDDFKAEQNKQVNTLVGLVYALLSLSVIVALLGIVNTLALSVHERTRELGMLRAVGMSKRQARRMVRAESVITAAIGATLGIVLGIAFAAILSRPLADEGFVLELPVGTLIAVAILAAIAGVLAAIPPARRAAKVDVLRAVTTGVTALETFRAGRDDRAWAVLEGFHALKHALRFGADVRVVLATDPEALEELASELAPDLGGRFRELASEVTAEQLRGLVAHVPHTGVLALARRPAVDVARVLGDPQPAPVVFLEDPRDLGNLGAVIRVAAAADAAAVLTSGSQDPWDPAALRGAAGLHYALPVAHVDALETAGRPLLAIDPGGEPLRPDRLPPRAVLAFGTERHGLSAELLSRADARLSIPMRAGVSSLNLATAVAAVLYSQRPAPL